MSPSWIQEILSPSRFIPHGHCYLWEPGLVWLHLLSDILIALSYFSIPFMLVYFVRKREDVPFRNVFLLFGLFIVTCGTTHLMSVWTLWHPAYWLSGVVKSITAVVSAYTALTLLPVIPVALALPSPDTLRKINQQLEDQVEERKQAEVALQYQLTFDQLIAEISTQFIDLASDEISPGIDRALETIAQFMVVDTSYVFQFDLAANTMSMTHEWVCAGHEAQLSQAQDLPLAAFPWASEILLQGEVLEVPSINQLPVEAVVDKENWQRFHVQSLIAVPLLSERRLFGWVGFASFSEDKVWVERSVQLLTIFAEIVNRALQRQQSEIALKESEDRWQLALEATSDGIWDWNIDTNELFISARIKQMLGYKAHEFISEVSFWANRIHPDDVDRVLAASEAHRAQKTPYYTAEYRLRCQDGRYIWVLDRAKALRNDAGEAIRMTGSISNINARKQAEADLNQLNQELELRVEERTAAVKESELRFRSLFESAPDFIYVLNEQGLITQVNSTVTERSGYADAEMIGQPLIAFLSNDTQSICQSEFAHLLAHGSHRQEMEFICKDGRRLMMDCSCTVINNDEEENYILVLQRDITQRQKDEQERLELFATLQESERRWQSFLDNVQLLVVGLDKTGSVEYVNPCCIEQMSCSKDRILGNNWFDLFVPALQKQRSQEVFEDILNGQDYPNHQNTVVTGSGDERLISWNTTLLKDTQGNPAGTLSIGEDITERHAVDRMKSEFISVVSHELRTPLTAIHGALDLLATGLIEPQSERGQHVFGLAVENSDRLVKLVNDILELERLESGKIKLHKTSISTKMLTSRIAELLELVAERAGIKLAIAQTDVLMLADGDRLIQVLTNLVGNAIKFSEAPATIWIEVEEIPMDAGKAVKFVVVDEGRGIPQDKVSTIFERFHQVDASDSRSKGGTGLGLAICRSIVQQHGGNIWVESTLGKGSRFMFTIPVHNT